MMEAQKFEDLARIPQELAALEENTPVLLGLSGGADSSALLHWLDGERRKRDFPLYVCHLNHGIRGAEAERDERFCASLAEKYGLALIKGFADVPARAKESGKSLETAAREERYAFFARVMKERKIPLLVTAHHADDQLETLLFRLSRGTGTRGLCGIAPVRPFGGGVLVRPLLSLSKREILDYCDRMGLSFVNDSTNDDAYYARNRIRRDVIPVLKELFPGMEGRAESLCRRLREDGDFLDGIARERLADRVSDRGELLLLHLSDEPMPIRRRLLHFWASAHGAELLAVHEEALLRLATKAPPTMEVALPGDLVCVRRGLRLQILDAHPTPCPRTPLTLGTTVLTKQWSCRVEVADGITPVFEISENDTIILKNGVERMKKGLFFRAREDGDEILFRGMHKKLRRLQADAEIPAFLRDSYPLLCDAENDVLWMPGVALRDGLRTYEECAGDLIITVIQA